MARATALAYHAVTDAWPHPLAIAPDRFRRQIEQLAARGFRGVTLSGLADGVDGDAVAVTFDDGFASVATAAKAILDEVGWPATVYVVTDAVDRGEPMRHIGGNDDSYASERLPLTWEAVESLAAAGWEIGSHTCTHRVLSQLADDEIRGELERSRAAVLAHADACRSISYPLGELHDRVIGAARAAGYTSGSGLAGRYRRNDPMAVPRVAIDGRDDGRRFAVKTSAAFAILRSTPAWDVLDLRRRRARPHGV